MVNLSTLNLNERGERIEIVGDICLNLEFWDCDCKENYIHPITQNECIICKSEQKDSPNSRNNEVINFFRISSK